MEALRGRAAVIDYLDGGAAQVTLYQDGAQVVTTLAERHCPTNDAAREQARRWVEEGVRT